MFQELQESFREIGLLFRFEKQNGRDVVEIVNREAQNNQDVSNVRTSRTTVSSLVASTGPPANMKEGHRSDAPAPTLQLERLASLQFPSDRTRSRNPTQSCHPEEGRPCLRGNCQSCWCRWERKPGGQNMVKTGAPTLSTRRGGSRLNLRQA